MAARSGTEWFAGQDDDLDEPVNCGAIPIDLLENEFLGHETGAFTSANSAQRGVVQEAEGGTVFLDEIDFLPPTAQVQFLRFLQDGHLRPRLPRRVQVRLILAGIAGYDAICASRNDV